MRSLVVPTTRVCQLCGDEHRAGQEALSHPWPGSPLHQRAATLVPGAGPPRAVRQLPTSFLTWPSSWKFQCWTIAPLHISRCKTEVFSCCVRHFPGKATFSSCWPFRFRRWKSESLQGLITTGTSPIQLGASRQASPNHCCRTTTFGAHKRSSMCVRAQRFSPQIASRNRGPPPDWRRAALAASREAAVPNLERPHQCTSTPFC